MQRNWLDKPVFILSIGKTGSTLLMALLDGNNELVALPEETDYFDTIHLPLSFSSNKEKHLDRVINDVAQKTHLRLLDGVKTYKEWYGEIDYSKFDFAGFKTNLSHYLSKHGIKPREVMQGIAYAYHKILQNDNDTTQCWIEKTPYHDFFVKKKVPCLESLFPNAKFIHLYRDPRDNYIAFKKKNQYYSDYKISGRNKWNIFKYAYDIRRSIGITKRYINKENHILLRYEDLVENSGQQMRRVSDFLGLNFSDDLLAPTKQGSHWKGNSMHGHTYNKISKSSLRKYEKYDNQEEMEGLKCLLRNQFKYLDYNDADNTLSQIKCLYMRITYRFYALKRYCFDKMRFLKYVSTEILRLYR